MSAERSYRRLIRVFPAGWRERHEEDLIATILEQHHADGQGRMVVAEALNLVGTGLLARRRQLTGGHGSARRRAPRAMATVVP